MIRKKFIVLFLMLALLPSVSMPALADNVSPDSPHARVYMVWQRDEGTGIYILQILLEGGPLCGLELEFTYNEDLLSLEACERGEGLDTLDFACDLSGSGRVKFLFWGGESSDICGKILSFSFTKREGVYGECEFSLSSPSKNSALAFESGEIFPVTVSLEGLQVYLQSENVSDEATDNPPSEDAVQVPTEDTSESLSESTQEKATECPTENLKSPHTLQNKYNRLMHVLGVLHKGVFLLTALTLCLMSLPQFLPDVFRRGYF